MNTIKIIFINMLLPTLLCINIHWLKAQDKTPEINHLIEMSVFYRNTETDKAMEYAFEALELSKETGNTAAKAHSLNAIGQIYYTKFNLILALDYFSEAEKLFKKLKAEENLAKIFNNKGVCYENLNNTDVALEYYIKALEIYEKTNNKSGQSALMNNIGIVYLKLSAEQKAFSYFDKALQLKEQTGDQKGVKEIYNNIAAVYFATANNVKALAYFLKCLDIETVLNDKAGMSQTYANIGSIYLSNAEHDKALESYLLALSISQDIQDYNSIMGHYLLIGTLFYEKNQPDSALVYFKHSLEYAKKHNIKDRLKDIYPYLFMIYEEQNNYEEALNYMHLYINALHNERKLTSIPEIVSDFEMGKKDRIIYEELLKNQKQKTLIYVLFAMMIFLFSGSGFYYKWTTLKQKLQKELYKSELQKTRFNTFLEAIDSERIRIAKDLHDTLGYMLATAKVNLSAVEHLVENSNVDEKKSFANAIELIDNACTEARNISHDLMPGALRRLGLVSAVKDMLNKNKETGTDIDFIVSGLDDRLSENLEINFYRIIQELLHNIYKHAGADKAAINLEKNDKLIILTVTDNGKGFNADKLDTYSGIGWKNIMSRVAIIDGEININSEKNKGVKVCIKVKIIK